jgi:hypothetical protein
MLAGASHEFENYNSYLQTVLHEVRAVSLKLIGVMNCDSIRVPVYDVNSPILACSLLSETTNMIQAENGDQRLAPGQEPPDNFAGR